MLEIKNLKKSFGTKKVLKGINLSVNKGDIIGIIGPSGCGKSTLLRCINLLEKPTEGAIIYEGDDLTDNKNLTITFIANTSSEAKYSYILKIPNWK